MAALAVILFLTVLLPARTVRIFVDGETTTVTSRATDKVALVEQAGIQLQPGDDVEVAGEDALVVRRATEAILDVDGKTLVLRTQAETIEELLVEADVPLASQDSVLRDEVFVSSSAPVTAPLPLASTLPSNASRPAAPSGGEPVALEVRRAVPFTVAENGQELQLRSSRETVATALRDVGVRLGPGDDVQPPLDTDLTAGLEVHVQHATQVVVTLPEGKEILYTLAETVEASLAEGGVELPADFRLDPPAETSIEPGLVIHVIGVSEEQVLETERIESRTLYEADSSLPWGERRIVLGQDGVRYRQYRIAYEDGAAISRELETEWYDPQPIDTVIYYSPVDAAPTTLPAEIPDELDIVRALTVYATWYNAASAGRSPSDPAYGITATGVPVDRGIIAVDPSVIPLGTRLYIPGYGYGVAADTGGGIRGNMIDLGYPDGVVSDWTSRWVEIYILAP